MRLHRAGRFVRTLLRGAVRLAGKVEDGEPVATDETGRSGVDTLADIAVEIVPFVLLECDVAGEAVQQRDVFIGGVELFPDVTAGLEISEEAGRRDLLPQI